MRNYFIFDGRASFDVDSACVVECFSAKNDNKAKKYHAKKYHHGNHKDTDTVLTDDNENIIY